LHKTKKYFRSNQTPLSKICIFAHIYRDIIPQQKKRKKNINFNKMSKIKINNFGPVTDGWVDIKKVSVFVGNQGSGKSTIAKLISTFTWIEKALVRGDYDKKWFERKGINRFRSQFLPYHRLDAYLNPDSVIEYQGDAYSIMYKKEHLTVAEISNETCPLPQIMYVPTERNFLTYIKSAKECNYSGRKIRDGFTLLPGRTKQDRPPVRF
jgi:hypothetical protein